MPRYETSLVLAIFLYMSRQNLFQSFYDFFVAVRQISIPISVISNLKRETLLFKLLMPCFKKTNEYPLTKIGILYYSSNSVKNLKGLYLLSWYIKRGKIKPINSFSPLQNFRLIRDFPLLKSLQIRTISFKEKILWME